MVYSSVAKVYFDEFPFRRRDHRKPSSNYFFLSHGHSDHMTGIKLSLSDPDSTIVCSRETFAVIKVLYGIPRERCLLITSNQSLDFDSYVIHAIDANHCVGSLMFVIETNQGFKEVYTGDFRLGSPIIEELSLIEKADHLWLDNTYGKNPIFEFPTREEQISEIITLILSEGNYPERDVWIAAYQIGKELLLKTISEALKVKIWAPESKVKVYKEIGGKWDIFTNDSDSGVFVNSRRTVENLHGIDDNIKPRITEALRISPTGWTKQLKHKRLDIHFFPYSDHCSYPEVHKFLELTLAQKVTRI